MKKQYIIPQTKETKVHTQTTMLTGSDRFRLSNDEGSGTTDLTKEYIDLFEEY